MRLLSLVALCAVVSFTGCVRRVVLVPPATGEEPATPPPQGMVDVNVLSEDEERVWDVRVDGQVVCQTPCTYRMNQSSGLLLRSGRDGVPVPALALEAPGASRALVVAEGRNGAKKANGLVFTTLGGMGVVTAIALTAVGCSNTAQRGGTCTAGLITGAVTVPLTAFAIWLLVDSVAQAHVLPVAHFGQDGGVPVSVAVTPAGLVGTF